MRHQISGDGPPIVLLHGIPGSGASWQAVADRLRGDHRVVVPDLIGFGMSPRSRHLEDVGMEGQAAALELALDKAAIAGVVLVGHDFGGPVALSLLRRRPDLVSALALLATNTFTDTPIPLPIRAVRWPLVGRLAARVLFSRPSLALMLRQGSSIPLDGSAAIGDAGQRRAIRTIFAASLRELARRYATVEETLGDVHVPTLVAWGDQDPFFPIAQAERTAAAIPGADLRIYEGCGHFIPEERPSALAAGLRTLAEFATRPAVCTTG